MFFSLDYAVDELNQCVDDMITTMKREERSQFLLYNSHKLLSDSVRVEADQVPPMGAEVIYIIHLHSFNRGKDLWNLNDQERLEIAKRHKEQGSQFFNASAFRSAALNYSKAIQYLAAVDPDTPYEVDSLEDYETEILATKAAVLLNLSACQLKFEQYDHVVSNCTKVLELEAGNVKAWYRRAKALLGMKDYETARSDLLKAQELDPSNQAIIELLKTVAAQEATHNAKYRDALKPMFS